MYDFDEICKILSVQTTSILKKMANLMKQDVLEIVLRRNSPLYVVCMRGIYFVSDDGKCTKKPEIGSHIVMQSEINDAILRACGYSLYAHRNELLNGYISLGNGCRMALIGGLGSFRDALVDLSSVDAVRLRIARKIRLETNYIISDNRPRSALIIGPPSSGKTTVLRSIAENLSDGLYEDFFRVCVVDERNEIFPIQMNRPPCLDVLSGIKKSKGINTALRLCSPEVIICDEIGTKEEAESICDSINSGVKFICSVHAENLREIMKKEYVMLLLNKQVFDLVVILKGIEHPGEVAKIVNIGEFQLCEI